MMAKPLLVSADPGSSDKGWAIASCLHGESDSAQLRNFTIPELAGIADELCNHAKTGRVLLSVDAPVRAFGGLQAPVSLDPPGSSTSPRDWPFDVNPFSQRPCEHALTSRPQSAVNALAHQELVAAIGALCGWDGDPGHRSNRAFDKRHVGVSVLGYQGAPHAPVVRAFLSHLETRAAAVAGVELSFETEPAITTPGITVLETHPAVALAFYALDVRHGLPKDIPKYKPVRGNVAAFGALAGAVMRTLRATHSIAALEAPVTDNELDALVGMLNLLDFASGTGDVFGTTESGYFLVARRGDGASWRELWQQAAAAVDFRVATSGPCIGSQSP